MAYHITTFRRLFVCVCVGGVEWAEGTRKRVRERESKVLRYEEAEIGDTNAIR